MCHKFVMNRAEQLLLRERYRRRCNRYPNRKWYVNTVSDRFVYRILAFQKTGGRFAQLLCCYMYASILYTCKQKMHMASMFDRH
jgi:hypothetical protein